MKRILSLILALVMVLGVMPMASAEGEPTITVTPSANIEAGDDYTVTVTITGDYVFDTTAENFGITHPWAPKENGVVISSDGKTATITYPTAGGGSYSDEISAALKPVGSGEPYTVEGTLYMNVSQHTEHRYPTASEVALADMSVQPTCKTVGSATVECKHATCTQTTTIEIPIDPNAHTYGSDGTSLTCTNSANGQVCGHSRTTFSIAATLALKVGQELSLSPTFTPTVTGATVAYSGYDNTVVSVSSAGVVKGLKKGTTTITATATVGSSTLTDTCNVTVSDGGYISVSNASTSSGTHTLAPVLYLNGTAVSDATFTFTGTGITTTTAATLTVTGSNTLKTVNIAVASYKDSTGATVTSTDGITSATAVISFYTSGYDIEVSMKDGLTGFNFDDATAITDTIALSTLITRTDYSSNPMGHIVVFGKVSDSYGKLTLPSAFAVDSATISDYNGLGDVKFTVLNNTDDYWATSYTIKDSSGLIYASGVVTINFKEGDAAIKYTTTPGKAFQLDSTDFKAVWNKAGYTGSPTYVRFEDLPYYGDLYETSAKSVKVTTTDYLYLAATGSKLDLDDVTYVPYGLLTNYTDEVTFAIYGGTNDATVVYGVMEVKVGATMNFTDVKATDYFYDAVVWAVGEGITSGTSSTTFSPNATCTRAQVVTFLYRAAGEPVVYGSLPFTDVKLTDYYYDAVLWAYQNDITTGLTATSFAPNSTVTRGQVVTFLHRALDEPYGGSYNPFTDVKSTDYYADAVLWAYKNDVTTGLTATSFGPASGCTRGQIVTFLYRAYEG